jgi:hypothetical protein
VVSIGFDLQTAWNNVNSHIYCILEQETELMGFLIQDAATQLIDISNTPWGQGPLLSTFPVF